MDGCKDVFSVTVLLVTIIAVVCHTPLASGPLFCGQAGGRRWVLWRRVDRPWLEIRRGGGRMEPLVSGGRFDMMSSLANNQAKRLTPGIRCWSVSGGTQSHSHETS